MTERSARSAPVTAVQETVGESQTEAAGEALGRTLRAGSVVLLYGDLGAGKTAFVRGMARGVGADADEVSSPTFTLIQEYAGRGCILYHVDLYRLEPAEIDDLGLDDLIAARGVVAIEWAERWNGRPTDAVEVWFEHLGEDRRRIRTTLRTIQQLPVT
jgi:tRNA threonylcarbamoyladenosine biosynthesis protein TsaE